MSVTTAQTQKNAATSSGPVVVVHGGAGDWSVDAEAAALAGVRSAATCAERILRDGGNALDAVVAAIVAMENDPTFNAGTGATLNLHGCVEMDATLMTGHDLRAGGVANLADVKNPILVARDVYEKTDHVLLAGDGALRFARAMGHAHADVTTVARREAYLRRREAMLRGEDTWIPRMRALIREHPELYRGTVGAVAVDVRGHTAAATSTGGVSMKLPGRVGDAPIPGAGNYATLHAAACATGRGELAMRTLPTFLACREMEAGHAPQVTLQRILQELSERVGDDMGLIAVGREGAIGVAHRTKAMPHAWAYIGQEPYASMRAS